MRSGSAGWHSGQPVFTVHPWAPRDDAGRLYLAPFCYDGKHPANAIVACAHRFAREMPEAGANMSTDFVNFSNLCIKRLFTPVNLIDLPDFDKWLSGSNYSGGRKSYLHDLHQEIITIHERTVINDSFIKAEVYATAEKLPRGINSYSDESKTILGGLFHAVDKATFKSKFFVKGTNPSTWPERCAELFGDSEVISTDFTSFEAHHRGHFAEIVFSWFCYMVSGLNLPGETVELVRVLMLGRNQLRFAHVRVCCNQRLMSGALWTSSANGVLNLLINLYLASHAHGSGKPLQDRVLWACDHARGLVEGDDGLFINYGQSDATAAEMGCVLKVERHERFDGAGFCGIVCDVSEMQIVKDPKKFLRSFFMLAAKYRGSNPRVHDQLLRAKAMSYYYQFRNAPIVGPLCYEVLQRTKHLTAKADAIDVWKRDVLAEAIASRCWEQIPIVSPGSRLLVERVFGFSVQSQLDIEEAAARDIGSIDLSEYATSADEQYVTKYVMPESAWPGHRLEPSELAADIYATCQRTDEQLEVIHNSAPYLLTKAYVASQRMYLPTTGYRY